MSANRRTKSRGGFTLIEIMVAITLLVIVLAIVYATFSSVVMSIERTEAASARLKTMAFVERGFTRNLAQATEGWLPGAAYRPYSAPAAAGAQASAATQNAAPGEIRLPFVGTQEAGVDGAVDTLTFGSSAPIIGGGALPGQMKICTYHIEEDKTANGEDAEPGTRKKEKKMLLVLTETPWTETTAPSATGAATSSANRTSIAKAIDNLDENAPKPVTRSVPIIAWDLAYFDGKQWVEQWDSQETGRLPWSVRVRVQLERPKDADRYSTGKLDPEKDPSVLELIFDVPAGQGVYDAVPAYVRPARRGEKS